MSEKIKTLYYYETPYARNKVYLTTTFDRDEAKSKQGFRIANMNDLSFDLACGELIRKGLFKIWSEELDLPMMITCFEKWEKDEFDEYVLVDVGYRKATVDELDAIVCSCCELKDSCEDRKYLYT